MASDVIVKFYSGTKRYLSDATDTIATCIGLQTDTGKLFWKMYGNKIYLKIDWNSISGRPQGLSDSAALTSAIQDTLQQTLPLYDFTELQRKDLTIDNAKVVVTGSGTQQKFTYNTGKAARPCWLKTSSALYSIEPDSVTIGANGKLSIELSRYLSYQNITTVPNDWELCYR